MNKLYTKLAGSDLKFSRFPFIKVLSLTSIAALLSSVSPVLAKNLDSREGDSTDIKIVAVAYPQSVISVYDEATGYLGLHDVSKDNYVTMLNTGLTPKVSASAGGSDYAIFLTRTLLESFVDNNEDAASTDILDISRNDSIKRMPRNGGLQREVGGTNVMFGEGIKTAQNAHNRNDNVAIGADISIQAPDSVAVGYGSEIDNKYSVAVGHLAHSVGEGSIAIGGEGRKGDNPLPPEARTIAKGEESIAIGRRAKTNDIASIALGSNAKSTGKFAITMGNQAEATKEDSMAIGRMAHALGKSSTALGSEYNEDSAHGKDDYTTAKGDYSTALGAVSKALEYGTTAVGHRAYAEAKNAISIGFYSKAQAEESIAIGANSIADVVAGVEGYSPLGKKGEGADFVWKSTQGAVSVGDIKQGKTRQIGGHSSRYRRD